MLAVSLIGGVVGALVGPAQEVDLAGWARRVDPRMAWMLQYCTGTVPLLDAPGR